MRSHSLNKLNNFIGGWYISKEVCRDLIKYYEQSSDKSDGMVAFNGISVVNKSIKSSTDVNISINYKDTKILNYYKELDKVCEEYKKKYKYSDEDQSEWGLTEDWILQKYNPTEGYFRRHYEKSGGGKYVNRHLVFMTYLNDVDDGGETEFYYQKLKVKPEIGLTLIWGSDWTFTHNGVTSPTETKYIATGWFSYTE